MKRRLVFASVLAATFAANSLCAALPAQAQQLPSYAVPQGQQPQGQPPQQQPGGQYPADPNAPQPNSQQYPQDPNAPGVARLAELDGTVSVKHGDTADQATAVANAPVIAGDYLSTGADGRAEVELAPAALVRAGANTQVRFTQLNGQNDVTQLAEGTLEVRVFTAGQDNVSVQTPSVDVQPAEAGEYLVSVGTDGNTQVTARSGSLAIVTPKGSEQLQPGQTMDVTGSADDPQYRYIGEVAQSDVEAWGAQRDQAIASAVDVGVNVQDNTQDNAPYNAQDAVTGEADLNQYGTWQNVQGYGDAWVPSEPAGWAPYSDGSWVNVGYYGPTWVSYEPWGWAPYHYGRWFYAPGCGWAWSPGPPRLHPMWSPALVAFFGYGGGVGVGVGLGFGNVGWVPLAPGEFYRPWWGPGAALSLSFNFGGYRNYAHGFIGVPLATWRSGVIRNVRPMSVAALRGQQFYRGAMPIARMGGGYARPAAATGGGWQHFGGAARPAYQNSQYQSQRSYGQYQTQRSNYQTRQYPQGYAQRQYAQPAYQQRSYTQQRSYGQSYQRSYGGQSYQRSYPQQRSYSRPQSSYSRSSAPSRGNSGAHSHGPGRP
jgi:hypothetical protein